MSAGDGYADAYASDEQRFHAMTGGAASQSPPAKPARANKANRARSDQDANPYAPQQQQAGRPYKNLAPREGCGPLCQIYTRLLCYLSALVCSAIIAIELEMIQNSDNLNGGAACPFELTKSENDTGNAFKCSYVAFISWAGMAVAGLFLVATTCYACYQRVRPNKMILFEVVLTVLMFILQLAGSLVVILGFDHFCATFTRTGQSCEGSTLSSDPDAPDAGTRDGFDNIYTRLVAMRNSAYALIAIWGLLTAILVWRYRVIKSVLQSNRPYSSYKDGGTSSSPVQQVPTTDPRGDLTYNERSGNNSLDQKLLR